jgi:hypothetical protein
VGLSELVLIYAMNHGVWSMGSDGLPQICLKVPIESTEDKTEFFQGCTSVPEEILYKWLEETTVKA